jgi:hypothetical protein
LFSPPTPFPQDYVYRSNGESLNDSDNSFTVGTFLLLEHKENYARSQEVEEQGKMQGETSTAEDRGGASKTS